MNNKNLLTIDDLNPILNHIGQFDHVSKTQIMDFINESPFPNKQDILNNYLKFHKNIPSFLTYKYNDLYTNNKPNASNAYVISCLIKDFCNTGSPLQLFHKLNSDNDFQSSRYLYNGFVITITKTLK